MFKLQLLKNKLGKLLQSWGEAIISRGNQRDDVAPLEVPAFKPVPSGPPQHWLDLVKSNAPTYYEQLEQRYPLTPAFDDSSNLIVGDKGAADVAVSRDSNAIVSSSAGGTFGGIDKSEVQKAAKLFQNVIETDNINSNTVNSNSSKIKNNSTNLASDGYRDAELHSPLNSVKKGLNTPPDEARIECIFVADETFVGSSISSENGSRFEPDKADRVSMSKKCAAPFSRAKNHCDDNDSNGCDEAAFISELSPNSHCSSDAFVENVISENTNRQHQRRLASSFGGENIVQAAHSLPKSVSAREKMSSSNKLTADNEENTISVSQNGFEWPELSSSVDTASVVNQSSQQHVSENTAATTRPYSLIGSFEATNLISKQYEKEKPSLGNYCNIVMDRRSEPYSLKTNSFVINNFKINNLKTHPANNKATAEREEFTLPPDYRQNHTVPINLEKSPGIEPEVVQALPAFDFPKISSQGWPSLLNESIADEEGFAQETTVSDLDKRAKKERMGTLWSA